MTTSIIKSKFFKIVWLALAFSLIFGGTAGKAFAGYTMELFVDGAEIRCDAPPYIENGRTFVPMRFAAEPLGAKVKWDNTAKTATFTKDNHVIKVTIGSSTAYVDGAAKALDAPAALKNGRTFVPIRFISESLDCKCQWVKYDTWSGAVYITTDGSTPVIPANPTKPANNDFKYLGYYFTYNALGDLEDYSEELTDVSHFAYDLKSDGSITQKTYYKTDKFENEGQAISQNAGHDIYMLVTGFSKADLTAVLSNSARRAKAIQAIKTEMNRRGLDGVDIDFESVDNSQRANYVTFIKELRQAVGNNLINISIMPRSSAAQTWLEGYDYAGLAKHADTLTIMCYNEHYSGGSPGPVASTPWVEKVLKYTIGTGVDSKQIILGLGSYGYDWPAGKAATSVQNTNAKNKAQNLGATIYRDTTSGCPFYVYYDNNVKHTVWFEDATSLKEKAALAVEYDLGGVGFWKLGNITTNIWSAVLTVTGHENAAAWQQKATKDPVYPTQTVTQ